MTIRTIHLNGERQSGNTTMGLGMLAAVRALGYRAVVIYPTQRAAHWAVKYRGVPHGSAFWPTCVIDNSGLLAGARAVMIDDSDKFKPDELNQCLAVVKRALDCQAGPLQLIIVGSTAEPNALRTDKPNETGWYWMRPTPDHEVQVVFVNIDATCRVYLNRTVYRMHDVALSLDDERLEGAFWLKLEPPRV